MEVNLIGAWRTSRQFVPGMRERGWGRVVNLSTGYAHIAGSAPQAGAYGLGKAALNVLTRMIAAEAGPRVKVNSMSPGWVANRMGGAGAPTSEEEGADRLPAFSRRSPPCPIAAAACPACTCPSRRA